MADLSSITAVRPTSDTQVQRVTYGATVALAQPLYQDASDENKWKPADCDLSVLAAAAKGIAITPGVDDGYGLVATGGSVILVGTTMAVGTNYIVSDTAGGIKPTSDAASGDWVTNLGNATSATELKLLINATGNQVP